MTEVPRDCMLCRERDFHDALASALAATSPPRDPDPLEREMMARMGNLSGLRILEMGCGTGDLTLQLLDRGATVTALDLSSGMVRIARERAERFASGPRAKFLVAPIEHTGLPSESFDLVVGKWILHHADVVLAGEEVRRLLRPGGRAVFAENSGHNVLLSFARAHLAGRWHIPRFGTEDEHPLTAIDFAYFERRFAETKLYFPDFCFFHLFDRQVFKFKYQQISRLAQALDHLIWERLPFLRKYSYHVILEFGVDPA